MSGLGRPSTNRLMGVVIGLVQLQLPVVVTKADLRPSDRAHRLHGRQGRARNLGTMDLVVFPEYSLHGLSMDTNPDIMCRLDGPESRGVQAGPAIDNKIWGCFFDHGIQPRRQSL